MSRPGDELDDLAEVLAAEDAAEDAGTLRGHDRRTCHRHRAWATEQHMGLASHRDPGAAVAAAVLATYRGPDREGT